MLAEVAPVVPPSVQIPVLACVVAVPFGGFAAAWLGARDAGDAHPVQLGSLVMAGLAAWGAFVVGLAWTGIPWGDVDAYPPWLLVAFVVPGIVGWYTIRHWARLRAALSTRPGLAQLAVIEIARNLGAVFFILHRRGDLAGLFAYPAAWGDILVGVTAPGAVWIVWFRFADVRRRGSLWQNAFILWSLVGIADMWMAVTLGFSHMPGATQLIGGEPSTIVFKELPMLLFPGYLVAFATMLHYVMLDLVLRPDAEVPAKFGNLAVSS